MHGIVHFVLFLALGMSFPWWSTAQEQPADSSESKPASESDSVSQTQINLDAYQVLIDREPFWSSRPPKGSAPQVPQSNFKLTGFFGPKALLEELPPGTNMVSVIVGEKLPDGSEVQAIDILNRQVILNRSGQLTTLQYPDAPIALSSYSNPAASGNSYVSPAVRRTFNSGQGARAYRPVTKPVRRFRPRNFEPGGGHRATPTPTIPEPVDSPPIIIDE